MSVLVMGALHLDVVLDTPRLPRVDETLVGQGVAYLFGGKGGNQAAAVAQMGGQVQMAGRVGTDAFGDELLSRLAEARVGAQQVLRVPGPSGMSAALVLPSGEYGAVIVSGVNALIDGEAVEIPEGTRLVLLQNEVPEAANLALARKARAAGARVVLNAAPMREMAAELLALTDVLIVNRLEAEDILGAALAPEAAVARLAGIGPAQVILTLGGEGLILWDGAEWRAAARRVSVISTHGAGDAFIGALAARLDAGDDLRSAADFAQGAAALHVSTPVAERVRITPEAVRAAL
jgi:ribokinase